MGTLKLNNQSLDNYFNFLTKLDTPAKKKLIIKLIESIGQEKKAETTVSDLYGAWDDERSTEEIIADIKSSRTQNNSPEAFE